MKKTVQLNDGWLFSTGFMPEWLDPSFDYAGFVSVDLPHNAAALPSEYSFSGGEGVYTYVRTLTPDEKYDGSKIELCFDGVIGYAEVYVNGMFVTSNRGDGPFAVDVSAPIRIGIENRITVRAGLGKKAARHDFSKNVTLFPFGGIHREVSLRVGDGAEISDVFVKTEIGEKSCALTAEVTLGDYYPDSEIHAALFDADGEEVGNIASKAVLGKTVTLTGQVNDAKLWTIEKPAMYSLKLALAYGNRIMDEHEVYFGFRSAVFKRDGFYLNGERLKLIGLNKMDAFPVLGRAVPPSLQRYDVLKLKELGCNVVRTHGLFSKSFIRECDKEGLLVIEDVGGDGVVGDVSMRETLIREIEKTVLRDRNSPSVIAWGVRVNDSPDCDELYFKTNKAARDHDPTRATLGSRGFMSSRLYEDVFAFNDYALKSPISRLKGTSALFVPYFISEHSGRFFSARRYSDEAVKLAQAEKHLSVVNEVQKNKSVTGCAGMAFADFDGVRCGTASVTHCGVLDENRMYKPAAFFYRSQSDAKPMIYVCPVLPGKELRDGITVYTDCDSIRLYRDGSIVGEFFPDRKAYAGLKHPPIKIKDFIGNLPITSDSLTEKQNKLLKYLVGKARRKGGTYFSAIDKTAMLFLKKQLTFEAVESLAAKYAFAPANFVLEGIKGGETVVKKQLSGDRGEVKIVLSASQTRICPSTSYEAVLVTVELTDSCGNRLENEFSPIRISVAGELKLIGDSVISLVGGTAGFFLITTHYDGTAAVTVETRVGSETIELEVAHERVEEL